MRMQAKQRRARCGGGHGRHESGEDENGEYALTEAYLALWWCLGGGEEDCAATSKMEMATVQWHGC